MLIWRGYGILVAVITIVIGALFSLGFENFFGIHRDWGVVAGLFVSGIIVWFAGKKVNDPSRGKLVVEKETGKEILLIEEHSMFFIKMQYWAFILGTAGIIMTISLIRNGHS